MAERRVNRTEERATVAPPLGIAEGVGDAVEIGVLPAVVARHVLNIAEVDHDAAL